MLLAAPAAPSTVQGIGNPILAPSYTVPTVNTPYTFLIVGATVTTDSILFAFSAYFIASAAVTLQVWRPLTVAGDKYTLVYTLTHTPLVVGGRENVRL